MSKRHKDAVRRAARKQLKEQCFYCGNKNCRLEAMHLTRLKDIDLPKLEEACPLDWIDKVNSNDVQTGCEACHKIIDSGCTLAVMWNHAVIEWSLKTWIDGDKACRNHKSHYGGLPSDYKLRPGVYCVRRFD